ncbi:MAG: zinc ribbon domain-containing protein [Phycisphaerae bacterium]
MWTLLEQPNMEVQTTKKCPFCAEMIQIEAIKCRYCGEFLADKPQVKTKWYFSTSALILGFLCAGPFVLPLVWLNPKFSAAVKVIISAAMIAVTVVLSYAVAQMYNNLMEQVQALGIR